ncbi:WXG100 family type VII secretion target [Actinokineospora sp. 24-640]
MGNHLVAPVTPLTAPEDGMVVYDFAVDAKKAIDNGDWLEAGIAGTAAGLDALAVIADPFGALLSGAFAWAIEHVDPLPEMLNSLAGNPDVVQSNATTWANVANHMRTTAADMERVVDEDTAPWQGPAVDSYRLLALGEAKLMAAASAAADAVSAAVSGAGIAVSVVRTTVRDLIADAMADIVQWLAKAAVAAVVTVGLATPVLVADVIRLVAKWSSRVSEWLRKIVTTMRKLADIVKKVKPVLEKVKTTMEPIKRVSDRVGDLPLSSLNQTQKIIRNSAVTGSTYDDQEFAKT